MPKKQSKKNPATDSAKISGNPATSPAIAESDAATHERLVHLSQEIVVILTLAGSFIPFLPMIRKIGDISDKNLAQALTFEPVLQTFGKDPEATVFYARMAKKRSDAFIQLVEVLRDTELDRIEFNKSKNQPS